MRKERENEELIYWSSPLARSLAEDMEVRRGHRHGVLGFPQGSDIVFKNSMVAAWGTCRLESPEQRDFCGWADHTPKRAQPLFPWIKVLGRVQKPRQGGVQSV